MEAVQASTARPAATASGKGDHIAWFPAALATVGTDRPVIAADGEGPARRVRLKGFGLDRCAVTNARFADFVAETGHVTDAERFGWSFVFQLFVAEGTLAASPVGLPWWKRVEGAFWRQPEGSGTTFAGREDHPVVHVSWNDAAAFAAWAGGRLPSETEWEHAARGGLSDDARFPWGDTEPDDETIHCNIWQGRFPDHNTLADGFAGTAPVATFPANGAGLHNMCGNVWEWCQDPFRVRSISKEANARNRQSQAAGERLMKGGSYLCHASYCFRYRIAARTGHSADTSTGHVGFRVAYDQA